MTHMEVKNKPLQDMLLQEKINAGGGGETPRFAVTRITTVQPGRTEKRLGMRNSPNVDEDGLQRQKTTT